MPPAQRNKRFSLNAASKETAMVLSRPLDKGAAYAVSCSRILVVCVLLLSALFVGLLANDVTKDGQAENLQTRFEQDAEEVASGASQKMQSVVEMSSTVASFFSSFASEMTLASLPFLTLKDLEAFAGPVRAASSVELFFFTPYLSNEIYRKEWESHAVSNQDWVARAHAFDPEYNNSLSFDPIIETIWAHSPTTGKETDLSPPYTPLWQMSPPPPDTQMLNFDMYTIRDFAEIVDSVRTAGSVALSAPLPLKSWLNTSLFVETSFPLSLLTLPVFSGLEAQRSYFTAAISAVVSWEIFFTDLLPEGTEDIMVVIDSCGNKFSLIIKGPDVVFIGEGDHHIARYDSMAYSSTLQYSSVIRNPVCVHKLQIYPTENFEDKYVTNEPMLYSLLIVSMFFVSVLIFWIYDCFVTQRQQRTQRKAVRTADLISSLFPATIQAQLFSTMSKRHGHVTTQGEQGKNAGDEQDVCDALHDSFQRKETVQSISDRPIAELFPEATVCFADIAGFTAWSSIREPSHVFKLLESIFRAFDEIAHKHGVFKVETVGDCYVSVVGVPEYCRDHALVMATFARECLVAFAGVVRGLELTLGPDTSDLAMRFGMHSGPVTAGVLRGDQARFQLFGDTVTTAAGIEHSGIRSKIHLSEQTASLLIAAGRAEWVSPREDSVHAEGKGLLKTFWCETVEEYQRKEKVSTRLDGDGSLMETNRHGSTRNLNPSILPRNRDPKSEMRLQRLIDWNAEILTQLLRQVVARRKVLKMHTDSRSVLNRVAREFSENYMVVEEVADVISMPDYKVEQSATRLNADLSATVVDQLHQYVSLISSMYRENPFHNFEHASHVTMSVSKLLSRIVAPQKVQPGLDNTKVDEFMHDHTYGITSDPLIQFAVVLSALIHDVDHSGVPNFVVAQEDEKLANQFQNRSIAEQNSLHLAWDALLLDQFNELRECIYGNVEELRRFRQLLVNSVIATDIFDKDLSVSRKERWSCAFGGKDDTGADIKNRKATIILEHLIQASDVAHTMQHWHVYQKWNERLFAEMYLAYAEGRSPRDPSEQWYHGELGFFDNYIIPLANKLKDCGVFGVASDEYLNYAMENRREWAIRGGEIVEKFCEKFSAIASEH